MNANSNRPSDLIGLTENYHLTKLIRKRPLLAISLAQQSDWTNMLQLLEDQTDKSVQAANEIDEMGMMPLHWVCTEPSVPENVLTTLLKIAPHAARVRNQGQYLPLHIAIRAKVDISWLQALLAAYPESILETCPDGQTPLELAKMKNLPLESITLLSDMAGHITQKRLRHEQIVSPPPVVAQKKVDLHHERNSEQQDSTRDLSLSPTPPPSISNHQSFTSNNFAITENLTGPSQFPNDNDRQSGHQISTSLMAVSLPPRWTNAPNCHICLSKFSKPFRKRHHCRNCGQSICSNHSSKQRLSLPHYGLYDPMRICVLCEKNLSQQPPSAFQKQQYHGSVVTHHTIQRQKSAPVRATHNGHLKWTTSTSSATSNSSGVSRFAINDSSVQSNGNSIDGHFRKQQVSTTQGSQFVTTLALKRSQTDYRHTENRNIGTFHHLALPPSSSSSNHYHQLQHMSDTGNLNNDKQSIGMEKFHQELHNTEQSNPSKKTNVVHNNDIYNDSEIEESDEEESDEFFEDEDCRNSQFSSSAIARYVDGELSPVHSFVINDNHHDKEVEVKFAPMDEERLSSEFEDTREAELSTLMNLGMSMLEKKIYSGAVAAFDRALEIAPDDYLIYNNLSRAYAAQDDLENAIVMIEKSLDLEPFSNTNATLLGNLYLQLGDEEKASEAFQRSLTIKEAKQQRRNSKQLSQ